MINLRTNHFEIKNIDTVLFDKDGTLVDLHYFWGKMTEMRVEEIIKRYHFDKNYLETMCQFLGYNIQTKKMLKNGITALYSRVKIIEIFKNNLKDIGLNLTTKELENIFDSVSNEFYKNINDYTKPILPAIDFAKIIKSRGLKLGIVTSDSKESALLTINNFGWSDLFDIVIGRESTKETKESGIPVKMALDILNANKENTLMIGDAPMDYTAAKNAGIENVILVSTGQITPQELSFTTPYVVESLQDVTIY